MSATATAVAVAASASAHERELAQLMITALNLEDVDIDGIDPDAALFGHDAGLGLDSIDALEIALAVQQQYRVELRADDQDSKQTFSSLRALSAYVQSRRQ